MKKVDERLIENTAKRHPRYLYIVGAYNYRYYFDLFLRYSGNILSSVVVFYEAIVRMI